MRKITINQRKRRGVNDVSCSICRPANRFLGPFRIFWRTIRGNCEREEAYCNIHYSIVRSSTELCTSLPPSMAATVKSCDIGTTKILVLVGLPGSGKSTFAASLERAGWLVCSSDLLRSRKGAFDAELGKISKPSAIAKRRIVVDRCNVVSCCLLPSLARHICSLRTLFLSFRFFFCSTALAELS